MAVKVTLREKKISGDRLTLYLDFYPPTFYPEGATKPTRRFFLKRYLYNECVIDDTGKKKKINLKPVDKLHNKETLIWAESVRQKIDNVINKPEVYTALEQQQLKLNERGEQNFVEYFKKLANKRGGANYGNWNSAYHYLCQFTDGFLKFAEIDAEYCEDFKEYLLIVPSRKSKKSTLKINSAKSYFDKIKAALKQAYKHDYLQIDINAKVDSIKEEETHREYLDMEELNALALTECKSEVVKKAGLFSALTGLRFSDLEKMIWSEVRNHKDEGYNLKFIQKKTKGAETMPISFETFRILGETKASGEKVFEGLEYGNCIFDSPIFSEWLKNAGINKHFTFHCFRHTFAVLQLIHGTDIYTLSKMLGHRNIKTTEIYARVADAKKKEASEKLKLSGQ